AAGNSGALGRCGGPALGPATVTPAQPYTGWLVFDVADPRGEIEYAEADQRLASWAVR
ncbi:hypothetical protein JNW90_10480, partial [Micromonospora sp. STR1s_5]|nr:hypothetical protein [Micromonospora sp. STR1s_5]